MSRQSVSAGSHAHAVEFRNELLGRLGLPATASDQDVEMAYNGLVEFLELAPREVKAWATARSADVDEAFALLSGPEQNLVEATQIAAMAQGGLDEMARPLAATPTAPATPGARTPQRTQMMWAIGLVVVAAIGFGVWKSDQAKVPGISGTPTNSATTAPGGASTVPVDQAKVAALMKKIGTNPKDIASLQALGNIYFAAGDYKTAAVWEQKVLDVDPKNQIALVALGAAQFNQGNMTEAKKVWLVAAGLYPNLAEVHYDLGMLYFSQDPPDTAKMTAEWQKVVAIDPNSNYAKTVATHLKSPSPSASATASAK